MMFLRTCIGCGCDDDEACPGGCAWHFESVVHPDLGICTTCAREVGDQDPETVIAAAAEDWTVRSQELAADRSDAGDLILPGSPEFYQALRMDR
jgi:hypothetical protein